MNAEGLRPVSRNGKLGNRLETQISAIPKKEKALELQGLLIFKMVEAAGIE